jgi:hypothetical protein
MMTPRFHSGRIRATKDEVETRRRRIYEIVAEDHPMTVRQVFYRAVVLNLVEKTEKGYRKVQDDLTELRRGGTVPYDWIIDEGRGARKIYTANDLAQALNDTRRRYRKDPWQDKDELVQVWVEKNALAGVIKPITDEYGVALMVTVGYSSISFAYVAGEAINDFDGPVYIYHFGDYDPSGQDAARALEEELRLHAPDADITFTRMAVTPEQIRDWKLPTRPTKASDPRAAKFESDQSVELDAIPPKDLRQLVRDTIEKHLSAEELKAVNAAAALEKQRLGKILDDYIESTEPLDYDLDAAETAAIARMLRNDQLSALYGGLSD